MRAWCTAAPHSSKRGRNATLRLGTALSCFSTINQIVAQDIMGLRTYFLLKSMLCLWWFFLFQIFARERSHLMEVPRGSPWHEAGGWATVSYGLKGNLSSEVCSSIGILEPVPQLLLTQIKNPDRNTQDIASEDKQGNLNHCSKKIFSSFLLHRSHVSSADPLAYLASCPTPLPPSPEDHKNIFDLQKIEHT